VIPNVAVLEIESRPNILGLKSNPIFESLRNDERYHAILRKMQLASAAI
jgi:hypothetical protein